MRESGHYQTVSKRLKARQSTDPEAMSQHYDSDEEERYLQYVRTRYGPSNEEIEELAQRTLGELLRADSSQFSQWMRQLLEILQEFREYAITKKETHARLIELQYAALVYKSE